uniref:WD repeat-containing protein 75 second beta-propeller domain-containing protein n=1 Tax=Gouania willdenowi TaxID=441366 RepID=A0A8C5E1L5_GOUWI
MVEHADIRVVHRGGSKINFRAPVISDDSRLLLCASGECVKVYSTSTEECVHHLRAHTDVVTGVVLRPSNHLQVYSCSMDGTIRLWDFTDAILIKTYVIGQPIYSIYASAQHNGVLFITIPMLNDKTSEMFHLVAVHLQQSTEQLVEARELSVVISHVSSNPAAIAFGRAGEYLASTKGLQLEVFFLKKQKSNRFSLKEENKKGRKNTFSCVTCHPTDDCIATGHEDGQIRLWRNFSHKKEYTYSTLHWHHTTVGSLCFTPEGTNLLSGGVESVLVQWRYNQDTQRDFLPRLGAAITHVTVSPDGTLFTTTHSDNSKSCYTLTAQALLICLYCSRESIETDLLIDPRSKALVMNGKPGHLQFYSLQRDKLMYNLDIVQQEYIYQSDLQQFEVVKAAFNSSGNWLATVEREQKDAELELNLKLWAFDDQTQSFVLNTTISAPHENRITALCFSPATDSQTTTVLVSSSKDGHFKAWQLAAHTEGRDGKAIGDLLCPCWSCDFVGAYHGLVPSCCCFSADGSLLAVSFQEVVTVWSSASWELLTTLSQPPGDIRDLCFGQLSCSKYLLGTSTSNLLLCWNLLTCSLEWSTSMDISLLLADPLSENMAAFSSFSSLLSVFVFKPSEPRPIFSQKAVCSGKVMRAVFAPREEMLESCEESSQWLNRCQLYFLSQHMVNSSAAGSAQPNALIGSHHSPSAQRSSSSIREVRSSARPYTAGLPMSLTHVSSPSQLLQTPAHVLPSTSYLCSMFVRSLLISVTDNRSVTQYSYSTNTHSSAFTGFILHGSTSVPK